MKWDVKGCSYDPSSVDRQTFNVKGTVTLPDGVKNPDKISTVIAVSITVNAYKGSGVKESDNKITGIDPNGKYDTNTKITFTAVGAGMDNSNPVKEIPVSSQGAGRLRKSVTGIRNHIQQLSA